MKLFIFSLFLMTSLIAQSGILDIQWPKPNPKQQKPSTPYPSVLTDGIKDTHLPVYIPNNYAYDEKMIVVADKNFYTISFLLDGATVMVSGDKTFQETLSKSTPDFQKLMKPSPLEFIQEEGIMSTDFNRHGVNYALSVECEDIEKDERCIKESFLHNLYNRLIMVGGQP